MGRIGGRCMFLPAWCAPCEVCWVGRIGGRCMCLPAWCAPCEVCWVGRIGGRLLTAHQPCTLAINPSPTWRLLVVSISDPPPPPPKNPPTTNHQPPTTTYQNLNLMTGLPFSLGLPHAPPRTPPRLRAGLPARPLPGLPPPRAHAPAPLPPPHLHGGLQQPHTCSSRQARWHGPH